MSDQPTPATDAQITAALATLSCWQRAGNAIEKTYQFQNYYQTIAFVNATAWISHAADHHPDLAVGYNRCTVTYTTHSVKGLSDKDLACAARIEALIS